MIDTFKKRTNGRGGFTLIELLVVIAIIGVLASIVLASLNNARRKSRDARRITDIKQIQLALELYFDGQSSVYPTASVTCDATTLHGLQALQTNGYIPQVPRDPLSNGSNLCYRYASPASNITTYHLGVLLEDHQNSALTTDKDCSSSAASATCASGFTAAYTNGFEGTSAGSGNLCTITAGTAQPGGGSTGERCYDAIP